MQTINICPPDISNGFPMVAVKGTGDGSYQLGESEKTDMRISDFFLSQYLVTQELWAFIMGNNPSHFVGQNRPVENVSFNDITAENGFLHKLNQSLGHQHNIVFRLPSDAEWEYAARGGIHWTDGFLCSGSNSALDVAWFDQNSGKFTDPEILKKLKNQEKGTETHEVGQKQANQLGIYDMCGNVWEWCQDYFQRDIHTIPKDGTPYAQESPDRVLRGGCHHNGAIHCTVSKRYAIVPDAKDECIGFRIAASIS